MSLTVENIKKLLAFAEKNGIEKYEIVTLNNPFIHLRAYTNEFVEVNLRTSNVGVRRLVPQEPKEEDI